VSKKIWREFSNQKNRQKYPEILQWPPRKVSERKKERRTKSHHLKGERESQRESINISLADIEGFIDAWGDFGQ
jgi:hypothetical protein